MRETFGTLLLTTQNYITDAGTDSKNALSATDDFLKKEINKSVRLIFAKLRNSKTIDVARTTVTVDEQQYYHYPPGLQVVESVTLEVGGIVYPLQIVDSIKQWEFLNQIEFSGSSIPQFIFPRRDDFGIWPEPTEDDLTITLNANIIPKDMTAGIDESSGTVAVTQNSATVTGTDTTFTAAMVGRWFRSDDDGAFYKISARSSDTSITLESVFEGSTDTSSSFIIGESPEVPVELHELIPYKAAATYLAGPRRSPTTAQRFLNYFWTGDFDNSLRRMNTSVCPGGLLGFMATYNAIGRGNSRLVNKNKVKNTVSSFNEWGTTLVA